MTTELDKLGARWQKELRLRFVGDESLGKRYVGRARQQVGEMERQRHLAGTSHAKLVRTYEGGVVITTLFDGVLRTAEIDARSISGRAIPVEHKAAAWIPRGFVLYPATDAAPRGWGLPVIPKPDTSIYDKVNRAPGLDVLRWTIGGALGQVLLTDRDIAYPREQDFTVPLLYSPTRGLKPDKKFTPPPAQAWSAHRLELAALTAQSPTAGQVETTAIEAAKRGVFERVNARRAEIGRGLVSLPIRGLYDAAQSTAEIMNATHTLGHFSERYPLTYQTTPDRQSKDGFRGRVVAGNATSRNKNGPAAENTTAQALAFTLLGVDPYGVNIYDVSSPVTIGAQQAFDAWMGSPVHRANIESTLMDGGHSTTTIGFKSGYAVQEFTHNEQWVECGNRQFISKHAEIPVISWFGFQSMNLCWETWPVAFNDAPSPPSDPLSILTQLGSADGVYFLQYYHAKTKLPTSAPFFNDAVVPALDSRVFMRGRSIGIMPGGAWVWAAAVQKFESNDADRFDVYRLVVLAHHQEDQPSDKKTNGMTRYLRVWWCDLPSRDGLIMNPESTIRGIYGSEDEGWPWDVVDSPWSWRGGDLVDVGSSDGVAIDLLKYSSQWVFSRDGMRAVCLRDHGAYADYSDFFWIDPEFSFGQFQQGTVPTALELVFDGNAFNPLIVASKTWFGIPPGAISRPYTGLPDFFMQNKPRAVDYTDTNEKMYVMDVRAVRPSSGSFIGHFGETATFVGGFHFTTDYDYAPLTYEPTIETTYTAAWDAPRFDHMPCSNLLTIIDVKDRVVMSCGVIQKWHQENPGDVPLWNPEYTPCWLDTDNPVVKIVTWRDGAIISRKTFSNPDFFVPSDQLLCYRRSDGDFFFIGTEFPLSANIFTVPSYAKDRDGAWVLTYCVVPQPFVSYYAATTTTDCDDISGYPEWECTPTPSAGLTALQPDVAACRGDFLVTSFASAAQIGQWVGVEGARTLYARAV